MEKRNGIYYEFYKNGVYKGTSSETLKNPVITDGIDMVPTLSFVIPLKNLPEENLALYDIIVYVQEDGAQKYVFHGVVDQMDIDYANYSVGLDLSHYVARMRDWAMPINFTVKQYSLSKIISTEGAALGHPNTLNDPQAYAAPIIEFTVEEDVPISMTFSASNKLEALSEILSQTSDLHFRVDLDKQNSITIGKFGQHRNVVISPDPVPEDDCESDQISAMNKTYVTMLTEPSYNVDYTNHFNRAVVFCGDVGEGIMHLTLKSIYDRRDLWIDKFPVGLYDKEINQQPETEYEVNDNGTVSKINNEKIYKNDDAISYADNDNREYYVTDLDQLNEDGGVVRSDYYSFSDMYPIPKTVDRDDEGNKIEYVITDQDRLEMTIQAYHRAIRVLKAQRPEHIYQFNCTALPSGTSAGDMVNFVYTKKIMEPVDGSDQDCSNLEERTIVNVAKWLFMTKRIISFDDAMNEVVTVTLDNELRTRATSAVEIELHELATDGSGSSSFERGVSDQGNIGFGNMDELSAWSGYRDAIEANLPPALYFGSSTSGRGGSGYSGGGTGTAGGGGGYG